jgi:phosphate transport system substrate-binding protein
LQHAPRTLHLRTLLLVSALGAASCTASYDADSATRLVITGSSTIAPLISEFGKRFEGERPDVRIDVQTGGSSRGVADVRRGLADIGMVSRALKASEVDLSSHLIARDGIGLIVHADNPVDALDTAQVADIYMGRVVNWKDVGGADAPITTVHKAAGRSTHELFVSHLGLEPSQIQASIVIGDNEQGIKSVEGNPNAIGYVSIGSAEVSAKHGSRIKLLALDGIPASTETVASGRFPLTRELNLIVDERNEGLVNDFLVFSRSPGVRDLIERQAFVVVD